MTVAPGSHFSPETADPQDLEWSGCVDPNDPDSLVRIGQKTTICVVLGSSTNWNAGIPPVHYIRLPFQPQADQYSRLHVPSSYQDLLLTLATRIYNGNNNVTIHVASQKALSDQRLWFDNNKSLLFPYLSAIIKVNQGVVEQISWANDCLFCSGNEGQCQDNLYDFDGNLLQSSSSGACPVQDDGTYSELPDIPSSLGDTSPAPDTTAAPTSSIPSSKSMCASYELNKDRLSPSPCDVGVSVVWTGTDADGNSLQSLENSNFTASCDRGIQHYEGARVLNGFTAVVIPRRNLTTGILLPFDTAQLEPMTQADVNYFSTVVNAGEEKNGTGNRALEWLALMIVIGTMSLLVLI
ncbi:expressed unknown protein [Seminavis robusta]|uniref:Uncharacterized protein n=1 Tax=Seminavis robusta TaxID=568900 RepID=A0A9N8HDF5_9STRA|nr:expressed unknown protein [Seminavis robusta]|eukprot:Sro257_g100920.1 n/a (352) ;mRNA; f:63014-64258